MEETKLQKILFPDPEICDEEAMYFRRDGDALSFDTYFNSFSIGKWGKYTTLDSLFLSLDVTVNSVGMEDISAFCLGLGLSQDRKGTESGRKRNGSDPGEAGPPAGTLVRTPVPVKTEFRRKPGNRKGAGAEEAEIRIFFPSLSSLSSEEILALKIRHLSSAELKGGFWGTETAPVHPVHLALGICTYQREAFIRENLQRVRDYMASEPDSPLREHLQIFISDNGRTLDPEEWNCDWIHVFPNKNAGGSGGFTRAMIEAILRNGKAGISDRKKGTADRRDKETQTGSDFTHMILTDDDIVLSPHVLERTFRFLQYLKPEYLSCMVGGALLDREQRFLQMEHGAHHRGTRQILFKRGWDLREAASVAANETEDAVNYCAWIYTCIPCSVIRGDNLPMPLFLHNDDIEYGIRNSENSAVPILFLNGICAWHPNTITKAAGWVVYYDVRNILIGVNSTVCAAAWKDFSRYASYVLYTRLFHYEYDSAERVIMGIRDYLKGPEAFLSMDGEKNHARVMYREKVMTREEAGAFLEALPDELRPVSDLSVNKLLEYLFEAVCCILPSRPEIKTVRDKGTWEPFLYRCVYVFDEEKGKGVIRRKDRKRMFRLVRDFHRAMRELKRNYSALREKWNRCKPVMTSLSFWEKYLGLD